MQQQRKFPWFIRFVDRLSARHERWVTEYRNSADYYPNLFLWASQRDERARAWMAEALSRMDYWAASRIWMYYAISVCTVGLFIVSGFLLKGCAIVIALLLLIPFFVRLDRWRRRRKAWEGLGEGKAMVYPKVEVKPAAEGSRVFQSYWTVSGTDRRLELDHPIELFDAVTRADECWQFLMPVPRENSGRVTMGITYMDVGLVSVDENGRRRLIVGGVVYYSYDPWTGRVETD